LTGRAEWGKLPAWCEKAIPAQRICERLAMGHYTRVTQAVSRMSRQPGRKLETLKQRLLKTERTS
jgi:hypothetical protein